MGLSFGGIKGLFARAIGGGGSCINTANPIKTGQTVSYATGDDGDLQEGRGVDFFTLDFVNPFGNTNRFTDTLGGQDYTNDIAVDWFSWNKNNNTVLIHFLNSLGDMNWSDALTACQSLEVDGISSWRLINVVECMFIAHYENSGGWNYAPISRTNRFWTSTTDLTNTARAFISNATARAQTIVLAKNGSNSTYAVTSINVNSLL